MKNILIVFFAFIFITSCVNDSNQEAKTEGDQKVVAGEVLPGPQLVTDAWMFIAGYKADPEVLKELLPEGLTPHPNNHIVINMYTVPDPKQTSGFGAYTLTYLTVELDGHDSYVMDQDAGFPGRYFVFYFNSSERMRGFTSKVGIPAQKGYTTTTVKDGKLTAELTVDGNVFIQATADVGNELGNFGGGHLNYFGLISNDAGSSVVKYPIPWNGGFVSTENARINFKVAADHPLSKLKPLADPTWAVWMNGSFVYPQFQVLK